LRIGKTGCALKNTIQECTKKHERCILSVLDTVMAKRRAKFNKSRYIWMSNRHIDPIDRMRRQRRRGIGRGPASSEKSAAAQ
jgi:hypothetical protein